MLRNLWRKMGALRALAIVGVLMLSVAAPSAAAAQGGATTWTVLVGGQTSDMSWQFMRFYPDTITINAGDTIVWKLNSDEPHTVTFGDPNDQSLALITPEGGSSQRLLFNPKVIMPQGGQSFDGGALTGSGQLERGQQFPQEYRLTFTKPGTYTYFCAFHGMMTGKVVVQAAGSAYPQTQAQIDADAQARLNTDMAAAKQATPAANASKTQAGANGTTTHQVQMGAGNGMMSLMRFSPSRLEIKTGDSVRWVQSDPGAPHTVTFASGGQEPEMVIAEPQGNGPPKLVINPQALAPAGGNAYRGQGFFNSGFIWGTQMPQPGPRNYTLTFTAPGTYEYYCILHDGMGMKGEIVVTGQAVAGQAGNGQGAGTTQGPTPQTLPVTGGSDAAGPLAVAGIALAAAGALMARRRVF